jgi:tetratricopeptide (TPR) repeat protein
MTWDEEQSESSSSDRAENFAKWLRRLVLGGGVLSLAVAAGVLLHAQIAERSRIAEVSELMASGREHEKAEDYDYALDSFQKAEKLAAPDPLLSRLYLGSLLTQQEEAHGALEQLAQRWVEREVISHTEEGHTANEDTPVNVLSASAELATGVRKADLLAHIGYAGFLSGCLSGDAGNDEPAHLYREALDADPHNPYAHAFWAHLILCNGGPVEEAQQHFAAALASNREHALVRQIELDALDSAKDPKVLGQWLQLVNETHKAGQPLNPHVMRSLAAVYSSSNSKDRKEFYAAVPPADHVLLARYVLKSMDATADVAGVNEFVAHSLEAAGQHEEAVSAWHDLEHTAKGDRSLKREARHALRRLEHTEHGRHSR